MHKTIRREAYVDGNHKIRCCLTSLFCPLSVPKRRQLPSSRPSGHSLRPRILTECCEPSRKTSCISSHSAFATRNQLDFKCSTTRKNICVLSSIDKRMRDPLGYAHDYGTTGLTWSETNSPVFYFRHGGTCDFIAERCQRDTRLDCRSDVARLTQEYE